MVLEMDTTSIIIIASVLSLSSALIYLFKLDFKRPKSSHSQGNSNSHQQNSTHISNKNKQTRKQLQTNTNKTNSINNQTQLLALNKNTSSNGGVKVPSQQQDNQSSSGHQKAQRLQQLKQANPKHQPTKADQNGLQDDELDSSILLGVFNPKQSSATEPKQAGQEGPVNSRKLAKRCKDQQRLSGEVSSPGGYSSEQLFQMIAATNLSREEIETAVESLLNKIELGESELASGWRSSKKDPAQRLRNQLRNSELALANESQKHEQSRIRLRELEESIELERSSNEEAKEEVVRLKKELGILSSSLERTRTESNEQQMIEKQLREENSHFVKKLEQTNSQLQALLASAANKETKYKEKLASYEISQRNLAQTVREMEAKLKSADLKLDQMRSERQEGEYKACAKISELEAEKSTLSKLLKDRMERLKELSESNSLLEKSLNELQLTNGRQEDLLMRLRDERQLNETSMKRTLCEMDVELKELQAKLNSNCSSSNGTLTRSLQTTSEHDFQLIIEKANQREQQLASELNLLREGLSSLLSIDSINAGQANMQASDWVQQYLVAIHHLSLTVQELRLRSECNKLHSLESSPVGRPNGSLCSSPNGRGSSRSSGSPDERKKVMEGKLLQVSKAAAIPTSLVVNFLSDRA